MWAHEYSSEQIIRELKINKNSYTAWSKKLREKIEEKIEIEGGILGGIDSLGNPIDVEIDESLFFKRKYNRGRLGNCVWVFCSVESVSGNCCFERLKHEMRRHLFQLLTGVF
jgi:hypothetical protein